MTLLNGLKKALLKLVIWRTRRVIDKTLVVDPAVFRESTDVIIEKGVQISSESSIGSYTYINSDALITASVIGRYTSIGSRVAVGLGEHDLQEIHLTSRFYKDPYRLLTRKAPTMIGNDVWIGVGAVVLQGIQVGDGAVVAANSVVTKDVAPFSVVAGNPARVIKKRFSDSQISFLIQNPWWVLNEKEARIAIERLRRELLND